MGRTFRLTMNVSVDQSNECIFFFFFLVRTQIRRRLYDESNMERVFQNGVWRPHKGGLCLLRLQLLPENVDSATSALTTGSWNCSGNGTITSRPEAQDANQEVAGLWFRGCFYCVCTFFVLCGPCCCLAFNAPAFLISLGHRSRAIQS